MDSYSTHHNPARNKGINSPNRIAKTEFQFVAYLLLLGLFRGIMPAETNRRDDDVLLYLDRPHVGRFDLLHRIGADRRGIFEAQGAWQDALHAFAEHRIAAVDPVPALFIPVLWWSLKPDAAGGGYVGPAVLIQNESLTVGNLPPGGLPIAELVALYLSAAPVQLQPITGRIPVRQYRQASPIWRRSVVPRRDQRPDQLEAWLYRAKALPGPRRLAEWYRTERAAAWRRIAVGRLFDRLAAGELVGWPTGHSEPIPATFWQSDVTLNLDDGALYGPAGAKLASAITVYRAGERPAAIAERQPVPAGADEHQVVAECIAEYRDKLEAIADSRVKQVAFVREKVIVRETAIRAALLEAFGAKPGGPRRATPVIAAVIAENREQLAAIGERQTQVRFVADRVPDDFSRKNIFTQLASAFGPASSPGRRRREAAAAA